MNPAALSALLRGDIHNAVAASVPGGIEAQEKAGQAMLVASAQIPIECGNATKAQLESLGFTFGPKVDELFVTCDLPAGWKKQGTDHSMWSDIIDEKGRKRAAVFYKAAFYDRCAHMSLTPRYSVSSYGDNESTTHRRVVVLGDDQPREFGVVDVSAGSTTDTYQAIDKLEEAAGEWLKANRPQWRDPLAYWD